LALAEAIVCLKNIFWYEELSDGEVRCQHIETGYTQDLVVEMEKICIGNFSAENSIDDNVHGEEHAP